MKRKLTVTALLLGLVLGELTALPLRGRLLRKQTGQQETQRSESGTFSQTENSEKLKEIYAVIDEMRDKWISEIKEKEERIFRLGERKKFWVRVSLCEAAVIATGAYIMYKTNK